MGEWDVLVPTSRLGFSAPAALVTGQASDASDAADNDMLTYDVAYAQSRQHTNRIHDRGEGVPFIWVELARLRSDIWLRDSIASCAPVQA